MDDVKVRNVTGNDAQVKPQETLPVNTKAKDTFFKTVYATDERKKKLASFLLGVDAEKITTANVRPVLFGNKENDLSFTCDDVFYLMAESQASMSPNMPYRMLEYVTAALRSTVDSERLLYGSKRVYFPVPKLYLLQTGLETDAKKIHRQVQYDIRLSDSYKKADIKFEGGATDPDLDAVVHVYDFRMTVGETLEYISRGMLPARFGLYDNDMRDYALTANGITYMQRAMKPHNDRLYKMPPNVSSVAGYLELLIERGIFVDLLTNKEVCDMTMAQFSRDDILIYQGREEGWEEGLILGIRGTARMCVELMYDPEAARTAILRIYPDVDENLVDDIIAEVYDLTR